MTYRIVQWGTGSVGVAAVRKMIEHPRMQIVGCFAHGEAKVGQDVGALCGVAPIGVAATNRIEEIIALKPDCVLYMPLVWSVDDMVRLLEAGINMISTANFITGRSYGAEAVARLNAAARKGGASLYGTGINPGLANAIGLALTGCCARVSKVHVSEYVDATLYASPDTWTSLGYGGPADAPGLAEKAHQRSLVFEDAVEMMAEALAVELTSIDFKADFAVATEDLALGYMDIAKGTVCGLRMTYSGMVGDKAVIELGLMWRVGYAMEPDWQPRGYVIEVEGEPSMQGSFKPHGDPTGGGMSTGMNAVHAIAAVCAARPGIVRVHELPMIVAAHCVVE